VASDLKLTAQDLKSFNMIDTIISEPERLTVNNLSSVSDVLKKEIYESLQILLTLDKDELIAKRQEKHLAITGDN
jgi:acetyl-CoA carboxylase alpha subunit